jgi:PST family polysaccharide transporter
MNKQVLILIKNFVSLLSVKGVDFLIPIIIFPMLINKLGLDEFGVLTLVLAISAYFGAIIQYGHNYSAVRTIARIKSDKSSVSEVFSNTMGAIITMAVLSVLFVISLLAFGVFDEIKLLIIIAIAYVVIESLSPTWLFQGIEKMEYIGIVNLVSKLFLVFILMFVIEEGDKSDDVLIVFLLTATMTSVTLLFIVKIKGVARWSFPDILGVIDIIKKGWPAFLSQFAPTLYSSSAIFILGIASSHYVVGVFGAATKFINIFISLGFIFSAVFYPFLSRNFHHFVLYKRLMLLFAVLAPVFMYVVSPLLIPLIINESADEIVNVIQMLVPMIGFIYIRLVFGQNFLMLTGQDKVYGKIVLFSCVFSLLLSLLLIPMFGLIGGVSILLIASFLMATLSVLYYIKSKSKHLHNNVKAITNS